MKLPDTLCRQTQRGSDKCVRLRGRKKSYSGTMSDSVLVPSKPTLQISMHTSTNEADIILTQDKKDASKVPGHYRGHP